MFTQATLMEVQQRLLRMVSRTEIFRTNTEGPIPERAGVTNVRHKTRKTRTENKSLYGLIRGGKEEA